MNFPHTFSSPAEAAAALQDMRDSNPSAKIFVWREYPNWEIQEPCLVESVYCDERNKKYMHKWVYQAWYISLHRWNWCQILHVNWELKSNVKSVTITSIQSVEPKINEWDKVLVISTGLVWTIQRVWKENVSVWTKRWEIELFSIYQSRDLIKLP